MFGAEPTGYALNITTGREEVHVNSDLDLAGTGSRRLWEIDEAQHVLWFSELGDLDGTHNSSF